jgi:predicted secreted hydrolase
MVLLCALVVFPLVACQHPARPTASLASPPAASRPAFAPVSLPADDAPHKDLTEWWYYTGHLWDEDGQRYGFEFVVFQSVRGHYPVGYMSHFAITDVGRGEFHYASKAEPVKSVAAALDLRVEDWTLQGGDGFDRLAAGLPGYELELSLTSQKPAALHHGGYISFGPAGDSYYYSRTRMDAAGQIKVGDEWRTVTGQAWFDHQWGDFVVAAVGGWDWFSLQLDDQTEVMLFWLRDAAGNYSDVFGTYVDRGGRSMELLPGVASIEVLDTWVSPRTGSRYPSGWKIRLADDAELRFPLTELEVTPLVLDQELAFETMPYWEGAVQIAGTRDGVPIHGEGYVELTGYRP